MIEYNKFNGMEECWDAAIAYWKVPTEKQSELFSSFFEGARAAINQMVEAFPEGTHEAITARVRAIELTEEIIKIMKERYITN